MSFLNELEKFCIESITYFLAYKFLLLGVDVQIVEKIGRIIGRAT